VGAVGLKLFYVRQPQHRLRDCHCLRAGETHHTNAAASGRSGDGDYGVIEVHGKIIHHRGTEDTEKNKSGHKNKTGSGPAEVDTWRTITEFARE